MITLALTLLLPAFDEPQQALLDSLSRYATLNSFSATLIHDDSSGLFPGSYIQDLKWKKDGRFELLVTTPNKKKLGPGPIGGYAPDYYSDGAMVSSFWKGLPQTTGPFTPPDNTSPEWEVSGGPILSFLVNTGVAKFYKSPPPGVKLVFAAGERVKWQGEDVREVTLEMTQGSVTLPIFMFLTKSGREFVGYEWPSSNSKRGFMHYTKRVENPPLPDTLGTHRKALSQ